jgi:kinesin family protein 4/21/27
MLKQIYVIIIQVLQRKTEEAAMATKRLKELLEARKNSSCRDTLGMNCLMWQ